MGIGGGNRRIKHTQSKSTITLGRSTLIVSAGEEGTRVLSMKDGAILATIPPVTMPGLPASDTVTNAATACQGLVFTANGGAGVWAYEVGECKGTRCPEAVKVKLVGQLDFGAPTSANHLQCHDRFLMVASGLGGLKLLYIQKP